MKTIYLILPVFAFILFIGCARDAKYITTASPSKPIPANDTTTTTVIKDAIDSLVGDYLGQVNIKIDYHEYAKVWDTTYPGSLKIVKADAYTFLVISANNKDTVKHWYNPDNKYVYSQKRSVMYLYPSKDSIYISYGTSTFAETYQSTFNGKK